MIHTTIGLDIAVNTYKVNGVTSENLQSHIEYNKTNRFGRPLIVDGKIAFNGYHSTEEIEAFMKKHNIASIKRTQDTAPYW